MVKDVYPILGRTIRSPDVPRIGIGGGGLCNTPGVTPESYEFFRPTGEHKKNGVFPAYILCSKSLSSWLGQTTGDIAPLEDLDILKAHTQRFIEWLDKGQPQYSQHESDDDELVFSARYIEGFYGSWLFPLETIREFEYDNIAMVQSLPVDAINPRTGLVESTTVVKPHPEFKTFRALFANTGWLEFLDTAIAQDWDFLIVVFD